MLSLSDYVIFDIPAMAWFMATLVTGIACLHLPLEIQFWFRRIDCGGFRVLAYLFQVFILMVGLHHLSLLRLYGAYPTDTLQVAVDISVAFIAALTTFTLSLYRSNLRMAFLTMFTHADEWQVEDMDDAGPGYTPPAEEGFTVPVTKVSRQAAETRLRN